METPASFLDLQINSNSLETGGIFKDMVPGGRSLVLSLKTKFFISSKFVFKL
jgi:hypothetical protein